MSYNRPSTEQGALRLWVLLIYSLPALPLASLTLPLYVVVPNFYASQVGIPLGVLGAAILAIRIFDAIIDPVIGYICDRQQFAFGRRRTWVLMAMPLSVLSAYMVFVPPEGAGLSYLILWATLLSISFSTLSLSYTAWGAELATGYDTRNRVSAFREIAILIGTLIATATPAVLLARPDGDRAETLFVMAIFIVIALPLTTLLAVTKVPEPDDRSVKKIDFVAGLKALYANRPFLRLIASFLFNGMANGLPATLFLFYVTDRLGAEQYSGPLLLLYFVCGMIGVPAWLRLSSRVGKHRAWCLAMIIACFFFAFAPFLSNGDVAFFVAITVLTGLTLGADLILPSSIQADVIDVDTATTGEQRSGLYFAAWSVATQLSLAAAVGLSFPVLEWAGFDATETGSLSPNADGLFTLAILYGWVPIVMKLIAIALMWNFPLDRAEQERLHIKIDAARNA